MERINLFNVGKGIFAGFAAVLTALAMFYMTGCATVQPYSGDAVRPTLREMLFTPAGNASMDSSVSKSVAVDNPFDRTIRVTVDCYFIHELVIPARSTTYILAETTVRQMYQPTCHIVRWSIK